MKSEFEIVEEYIDYYNGRDFVNNLTIPDQVLYKCMIRDSFSFKCYMLHVRIGKFINEFIDSVKVFK